MKRRLILTCLLALLLSLQPALADDFDDLGDLADDAGPDALSEMEEYPAASGDDEEESKFTLNIGGYLKALGYWNEERYSDTLWEDNYNAVYKNQFGKDIPPAQKINGYNYIGTRLQIQLEAFLEDKARMFSAFNINYNTAHSIHDSSGDNSSAEQGSIKLVESYIEIYQGNTTWKVGSQLVTWGYMEGIEVPTDRVNARDYSYKSTEYEDSKLPSTGVLLTQHIWDSYLDIMFIPISQVNTNMEFQEYLYPEESEQVENKPNNGKGAIRFSSSIGNLDFALSYVEGLDPAPDLIPSTIQDTGKTDPETGEKIYLVHPTGKQYNRLRSPGLDLQYNFGSVLAKASYINNLTEDEDGEDKFIKNNWSKYLVGAEFKLGGSTINFYAGQHLVENFQDDNASDQTNFMMGQLRERTDFVSGHINANFLTGDALNIVLLFAGYWDEESEPVQSNVKATMTYKLADGLELVFSPSYMDLLDNIFVDYQCEVKYSF